MNINNNDSIWSVNMDDPIIQQLIDDVERYDKSVWYFYHDSSNPWCDFPVFDYDGDIIDKERTYLKHKELCKSIINDLGFNFEEVDDVAKYIRQADYLMNPHDALYEMGLMDIDVDEYGNASYTYHIHEIV